MLVATGSVLLPGLGHLVIGKRRIALLYLVPTLVVMAVVIAWALSAGVYGLAAAFVAPGVLTLLGAANIMVAGWRTSAAVEAVGRTRPGPASIAASAVVVLLLVAVPHLVVADAISAASDFLDTTFAEVPLDAPADEPPIPDPTPDLETPTPTATPYAGSASPGASASAAPSPSPTAEIAKFPTDGGNGTLPAFDARVPWTRPGAEPWGHDGRFDLLLLGSDAGRDRWSRRADVMLLVEVDVKTGAVAMVGLPRNLQNAPYPPGPARDASACGCQPGLLNEMYVEATVRNPGRWPGTGAVKGIGAIRSVVSEITGRPIDAVLIVDLQGVIRVVDAMGGVDINVPEAVRDDFYPDPFLGDIRLRIKAGRQHFDGRTALAYARSRHQDSDYGRMERQQILLLAIREQLGPATILSAPALFGAAKGTAWTRPPAQEPAGARGAVRPGVRGEGQAAADRAVALPVVADGRLGDADPQGCRGAPSRDACACDVAVPAPGGRGQPDTPADTQAHPQAEADGRANPAAIGRSVDGTEQPAGSDAQAYPGADGQANP